MVKAFSMWLFPMILDICSFIRWIIVCAVRVEAHVSNEPQTLAQGTSATTISFYLNLIPVYMLLHGSCTQKYSVFK